MCQGTLKNIRRLFNQWWSHGHVKPQNSLLERIHTQILGWMFCGLERRCPHPLCWNLGTLPKRKQGAVEQRRNTQVNTIQCITGWGWVRGKQPVRGWSLLLGLHLNFLQCLPRVKLPAPAWMTTMWIAPGLSKAPWQRQAEEPVLLHCCGCLLATRRSQEKVNLLLSCTCPR